ncbi:MAG: protein-export chaperone SecB [Porticoccaceae bacterium]|nr:protein-export chaperone SecB [Porticoccaceae bacterium]
MTSDNPAGAAGAAQGPQLGIARLYVKDLSFESPQGPEGLSGASQARVDQDLGVGVRRVEGDNYEVVLKLTVTMRDGDRTLYLVELEQAGQFLVRGLEEQALGQVLNIHCPTVLFPYARETVDSVLTRGGFPPLLLPPVNFEALYRQALEQRGKPQDA